MCWALFVPRVSRARVAGQPLRRRQPLPMKRGLGVQWAQEGRMALPRERSLTSVGQSATTLLIPGPSCVLPRVLRWYGGCGY